MLVGIYGYDDCSEVPFGHDFPDRVLDELLWMGCSSYPLCCEIVVFLGEVTRGYVYQKIIIRRQEVINRNIFMN